jgi:hypothetical protein
MTQDITIEKNATEEIIPILESMTTHPSALLFLSLER